MACDGVWDVLENEEVVGVVWESLREKAERYRREKRDIEVERRCRGKGLKGQVGVDRSFGGQAIEKKLFFEGIIDDGVCGSFYNNDITINTNFDNITGEKCGSGEVGFFRDSDEDSDDFFDNFDANIVEKTSENQKKICENDFEKSWLEDATNYAVSAVINMALGKKSGDNITVILVMFKPLSYFLQKSI